MRRLYHGKYRPRHQVGRLHCEAEGKRCRSQLHRRSPGKPSGIYDASCDGTWLLRQDIAENRVWEADNVNKLESSDIHAYLNNTWINRYDANIKSAIKQVKIPYRQNGGSGGTDRTGANGLSCKIFLLSGYEVGFTTSINSYFPVDGAKLSYFISGNDSAAMQKRVAKLNGSATRW